MVTTNEEYKARLAKQQSRGGGTGKTPEQLEAEAAKAAKAEEERLAEIARKKAEADRLAAEQAASKKPAEFEAHKPVADWKLKAGKGDIWGAAKSWWNKDDKPKKRKGDTVKNYARGGGVRPADNEYR
tara:strand:+ start:12 stop:395 length:384 start_codon:yes stop_codon:yes gene_type:complete